MSLIEHYLTLRQLHVGFVTASGTLFALQINPFVQTWLGTKLLLLLL